MVEATAGNSSESQRFTEQSAAGGADNGKQAAVGADWSARTIAVLCLFLFSGFSGLIYEVIWLRLLTYIFGATQYAVATVLAAFMGGLALGSWYFGKIADRSKNPLRLYAQLELAIGIFAFALPFALRAADPLYKAMYNSFAHNFGLYTLCRFVVTFLILLVPSTCLGATLPVLTRWAVRSTATLGISAGRLYAVNTFGAVCGVFTAGFILIAMLGVRGTIYLAVGVNLLVAATAFVLSAGERDFAGAMNNALATEPPLPGNILERITPQLQRWVFWIYGGSGVVALAYQIIWFRTLVFSFLELKNTTYAFSAMLTVFLTGLALGGAVGARIADTLTHPARCFALVQFAIGLTGAFSFFVIYQFTPNWAPFAVFSAGEQFHFGAAAANLFMKTLLAIGLPTFLMGLAWPIALRVLVSARAAGTDAGRLYAVNTCGAIIGALLGGFVLIPLLTLTYSLYLLSVLNMVFALVVLLQLQEVPVQTKNVFIGLAVAVAVVIWFRIPGSARFQEVVFDGTNSERIVGVNAGGGARALDQDVAYYEGPLATVSVVENTIGERELRIDNVGVAGTDKILLTDQKSLAHIPMLFLPQPKRALTVGFGSGGASWSFLQYPMLEQVDCVEICAEVTSMARFLTASNHGLLEQPRQRFRIIIDDARSYLRFTETNYDVIATDCTDLRYKTNANLYDEEYFKICKQRLTPDGMVVVWMPLGGLSRESFLVALRTFASVFPEMKIWYMNNASTHYILLLGTKSGKLQIDYKLMQERLAQPAVAQDLAEIDLADANKILSCFVTDAAALGNALTAVPLNTEDRPWLEFHSPLYGYGSQPLLDNLDFLLEHRADVRKMIAPQTAPANLAVILQPWYDAVAPIIAGHKHYRLNEVAQACKEYLAAQQINPADESVRALLEFRDLKKKTVSQPGNSWAQVMLGEVLRLKGRPNEALDYYSNGLRLLAASSGAENYSFMLLQQGLIADALLGSAECMIQDGNLQYIPAIISDVEQIVNSYAELAGLQQRIDELKKHLPQ